MFRSTRRGPGFMAGTPVHTKDGLVPIEAIREGDWVLTQPDGKGERVHRRVTSVFAHDEQEIQLVRWHQTGPGADSMALESVGLSVEPPFWVAGMGWTRAEVLRNGDSLELADGTDARVICSEPVYQTATAGVGWARRLWGIEANDGSGEEIDFRGPEIRVGQEPGYNVEAADDPDGRRVRATVFRLDVQELRTFYVGRLGVWVHNIHSRGGR